MKSLFKTLILSQNLQSFVAGLMFFLGLDSKYLSACPIVGILSFFLLFKNLNILTFCVQGKTSFKKDFLTVLIFSFGVLLTGFNWLPWTFREFGHFSYPASYLLAVFSILAFFPQLYVLVLLKYFSQRYFKRKVPLFLPIPLMLFLLVCLELFTPQLFPVHLGHLVKGFAPYIGLSSITGYVGYGLMSYMIVFFFLLLRQKKVVSFSLLILPSLFFLLGVLFPLNYDQRAKKGGIETHLRLVQANIGNNMKVSSELGDKDSKRVVYKRYYDLSVGHPSERKLDLIIWPETAWPLQVNFKNMQIAPYEFIPLSIERVINYTGAEVLWGGYDYYHYHYLGERPYLDAPEAGQYNSVFLAGKGKADGNIEAKEVYHKRLLMPFGEMVPYGFKTLAMKVMENFPSFNKGTYFPLFWLQNGASFITCICYEILFSSFMRDYLNANKNPAHFIVNLANDSWYGDSHEPWQHKFLASWRALEFNLPVVRMTNTGISSILYPDGTEGERIRVGQMKHMDHLLKTYEKDPSFYQKYYLLGAFIFWMIFLVSFSLELYIRKAYFKDRPSFQMS